MGLGSQVMSRGSSNGDIKRDIGGSRHPMPGSPKDRTGAQARQEDVSVGLFHVIQQLAADENALWNILDGLKSSTTHSSFFCREYWGCSCSQALVSLEKLGFQERLKRQVQQSCVLEALSLGVAAYLCSGVMQGISVTIRSRLRNLLYYVHENCMALLDLVCQKWMQENLPNQAQWQAENHLRCHCPDNLNLDILVRVKRYRRLRKGEHATALRQHNEMIVTVLRQLCRGAAPKRPPLSSRGGLNLGDRSPGGRSLGNFGGQGGNACVLNVVNDILTARGVTLDRLKPNVIRAKMLQHMCFKPLLNTEGIEDCPWPTHDQYTRYGDEQWSQDAQIIWFEPLPPMLPNLEHVPKLPLSTGNDVVYTLVLDLDETLVHYFEVDGLGNYDVRPGTHEFLERMNQLGYEVVVFTAATQDYADWVIDQIDANKLIHHRLYRQHALPWGPIFVKDLSRLGRELNHILIIDNVAENFMLQPNNGIFICTWYDDPNDTALSALTPLLDELIATRSKVPEILDKYRDQIPTWAGFDQYSEGGADYGEYDIGPEDSLCQEQSSGYGCGHDTLQSSLSHGMTQPLSGLGQGQPRPFHHLRHPDPMMESSSPDWDGHSADEPQNPVATYSQPPPSPYAAAHPNPQDSAGGAATHPSPGAFGASRYRPPLQQQQCMHETAPVQPTSPGMSPMPCLSEIGQANMYWRQAGLQAGRPPGSTSAPNLQPQQSSAPPPPAQQGVPRPAFSASGISGPYQAPPPQMMQGGNAWGGRPAAARLLGRSLGDGHPT